MVHSKPEHDCKTDNISDEMLTQMFFKVGSKYLATFQTSWQTGGKYISLLFSQMFWKTFLFDFPRLNLCHL